MKLRAGQEEFIRGTQRHGVVGFLCRRQYGKTTTFAQLSLLKMMARRNHTVIFGSAKLTLGREIVLKESQIIRAAMLDLAKDAPDALQQCDGSTGRRIDELGEDDFADLFESQRLETRFYHDRTNYSRTKVIALTPDSVGETGDLLTDELRAIRNWQEVCEAVEPIVASNPDFRWAMCTTVPVDDSHYGFEQLAPPPGTEFKPNPSGNWYVSEHGIDVLRVDAYDAAEDDVPLYHPRSRERITPQQHRALAIDRDAWDRNYGIVFKSGGTAACSRIAINTAMAAGQNECVGADCDTDDVQTDVDDALMRCAMLLTGGRVGVGYDIATTTKKTSNPSSLTICEEIGRLYAMRLIMRWKTADPDLAEAILREALQMVADPAAYVAEAKRQTGLRARRLAVDASNERYFAQRLKRTLGRLAAVELVISGETREIQGESIRMKELTGNRLVSALEDGQLWLPNVRWLTDDWRLVRKEKGQFVTEVSPGGFHGDTFDSSKLALHALQSGTGVIEDASQVRLGGNSVRAAFRPQTFRPR